jgi:hypothetical protein
MAKIELPATLLAALGPEMKMDIHWVDVKLCDGQVIKNLVVRGGRYITGRSNDSNGEGDLPFTADDIRKVRRHSILPFWW